MSRSIFKPAIALVLCLPMFVSGCATSSRTANSVGNAFAVAAVGVALDVAVSSLDDDSDVCPNEYNEVHVHHHHYYED